MERSYGQIFQVEDKVWVYMTDIRERMRERFEQFGGNGFTDHELLEMLLYYAYPRRDTNEKAHEILNEFGGSVTRLFNSDTESIINMCGISRNVAVLIGIIGELSRRMSIEKWNKNVVLDKTHISGEYALSYLNNLSWKNCISYALIILCRL